MSLETTMSAPPVLAETGSFRQTLQFANGSILVGGIPLLQLAPLY